jgi:nickel superoxide dismutase
MPILTRLLTAAESFAGVTVAAAHCDLPCGVYDPAQARIEAESVMKIQEKYQDSDDEVFRQRCVLIKEERADLVKHHLWVLWTDYFTDEHLERWPNLHELFWRATKLAGEAKSSEDPSQGKQLLDAIDEISDVFWESKGEKPAGKRRSAA